MSERKTAENQIRLNGSGVACGDVDGDGKCDVFFAGLEGGCRLYKNLGDWKFQDITASAGVACADQFSTGAVLADVDGDGDLDLVVNGIGTGSRLFVNDGKGVFRENEGSGLSRKYAATTCALADIDGNGTLDMYVANYRTTTIRTTGLPMLRASSGKIMLRPQDREDYELSPTGMVIEHGEPHFMYLNNGSGSFTPVPWTNGAFLDDQGQPLPKQPKEWGLSATFRDLNGDRAPDLYVCNDFASPDRICTNTGVGVFRSVPATVVRNTCTFSMAVDFADINRDGYDDFFNADMLDRERVNRVVQFTAMEPSQAGLRGIFERPQINRNTLHINRGDGTFAEAAYYAGVESTGWTWSPIFTDVDLDGYEDLLLSTGHSYDTQDLDATRRIEAMGPMGTNKAFKILLYPKLRLPRLAYKNMGDLKFTDASAQWHFNDMGVAQGMALADLDNDGDMDVVMNSLNEPARIYQNTGNAPRVAIRLSGSSPNTGGTGARILVHGGAVPMQSQEMMCGGRYVSSDEPLRVFAAGNITNKLTIEVRWRSGKNSYVSNAAPNMLYVISESEAQPDAAQRVTADPTLFEHASQTLEHTHHEEPFDDFARQPLLPNKLSQLGPGVAWGDLNGDGYDDLVVTSGKGGVPALLIYNPAERRFDPRASGSAPLSGDLTAPLILRTGLSNSLVLAGFSNYESPETNQSDVSVLSGNPNAATPGRLLDGASAGPIAAADVDGDGKLEVFVGGRVLPAQYPKSASSKLLRVEGGKLQVDTRTSQAFAAVGLVSSAIFTDLTGDGLPELVLALEWGPIKIFENKNGVFKDATKDWGMADLKGFWNGVTAGDFNGDGLMDLVGCNWGMNTKYRPTHEHPGKIYFGDFNLSGGMDVVEAYFDERSKKETPERDFDSMAAAMPYLRGKFATYRAFGVASLQDVLGEKLSSAQVVEVTSAASMVFLNQGGKTFKPVELPTEAQLSPAFGAVVADFDGDGAEDLFLAQNFFATQPQTTRSDAGRGLLLLGDGKGGFRTVAGQNGGISAYGEQRGAAACDYDKDGRTDLALTQNSGPTLLWHNKTGKPGLRARLAGTTENPDGIGAVIWCESQGARGPSREVRAGGGYWSQDSACHVLARKQAMRLFVRWPGGKQTSVVIPDSASEVICGWDGKLSVVR